jgi:hypothetical protein
LRDDRQWLNPAAFAQAPNGRRGTSASNNVWGPDFMVWDFSARKKFRFTEKMNLRLQIDLFNAFNRANFSNLGTNVANFTTGTTIGRIDGAFGVLNTSGPGRSIQLGAKFVF